MNLYLALLLVTATIKISVTPPMTDTPALASCTGVFVGPDEVLTARHCMRDNRNHQWIKTEDGKSYKAEIEAIDTNADLALLKVPTLKDHAYVKLGAPAKITEHVYTVNSGDSLEGTYNEGIIANHVKVFDDEPSMLMHNVAILHGASGSGLFNKKGKLIGINTRGNGALSLAVDVKDIKEFIDNVHEGLVYGNTVN